MSLPRVFFGLAIGFAGIAAASAAEPLHVYGPGGPYPAMKEAAETFGKAHGVDVQVTAGRPENGLIRAKAMPM
jgi:accessory colonization factor AcfC